MKRIKQIAVALLCCLFIPCAIASDTNMNLQPGLFKKLLAQSPSESLQELESLGLVLPEAYEIAGREYAEIVVGEVLQGLDWENYNYPNYSYTEAKKLGIRIVNLLCAHDPELNAARRENYAFLGKGTLLYFEGEVGLALILNGFLHHLKNFSFTPLSLATILNV